MRHMVPTSFLCRFHNSNALQYCTVELFISPSFLWYLYIFIKARCDLKNLKFELTHAEGRLLRIYFNCLMGSIRRVNCQSDFTPYLHKLSRRESAFLTDFKTCLMPYI